MQQKGLKSQSVSRFSFVPISGFFSHFHRIEAVSERGRRRHFLRILFAEWADSGCQIPLLPLMKIADYQLFIGYTKEVQGSSRRFCFQAFRRLKRLRAGLTKRFFRRCCRKKY
jgi:hypothetical protein